MKSSRNRERERYIYIYIYIYIYGDTPSRYLPVAVLHSTTCYSYACTAHALHGSGGHSHNVMIFAGGVALYLARVARLVKLKFVGGSPCTWRARHGREILKCLQIFENIWLGIENRRSKSAQGILVTIFDSLSPSPVLSARHGREILKLLQIFQNIWLGIEDRRSKSAQEVLAAIFDPLSPSPSSAGGRIALYLAHVARPGNIKICPHIPPPNWERGKGDQRLWQGPLLHSSIFDLRSPPKEFKIFAKLNIVFPSCRAR